MRENRLSIKVDKMDSAISKKINMLKGIAILMVVIAHLAPNISRGGVRVISALCNYYGGILGRIGVLIFLVISGLLYANSDKDYTRISIRKFVTQKLLKVYPLYITALAVCIGICFTSSRGWGTNQLVAALVHAGMLQSFVPTKTYMFSYLYNEPMWYMSMMLFIWLMLKPTIVTLNRVSRKHLYLLIAGIIFILQGSWIVGANVVIQDSELLKWVTYVNPVFCYSVFLFAYCLNSFMKENYAPKGSVRFYILFTFLVLCMMAGLPFIPLAYRLYVMEIPITLLISYICFDNNSLKNEFASFFQFVGKRSTTIFIVHFVPILLFRKLDNFPYVLGIIICVVMIIFITELYEYFKRLLQEKRLRKNA